ncbi:MAG: hypothetical protein HYZ56_01390 [Nitrosopumilales archaeon]|nr:hypothetical protein [Nitrosopumilales archaeon]
MATDVADKESLLIEYRIAHEQHNYYGKILWQIASIFFPATLAVFAFGVQQDLSLDRFIPLNFVLSALLLMFYFQAKRVRWLAFLQMQRCVEIEKILPMKLVTYQRAVNKKPIEVAGEIIKPQRVTGKHLNQGTPIALIIIFWGYIFYKMLVLLYSSLPTS